MKRGLVVGAVVAGLQVASAPAALADASEQASCVGIESSSISPAGSTDEFPGGRPELQRFVLQLSDDLGLAPGAILSSAAHEHAGSHEACDDE